jgi:nucleoside diphosphate kinase
MKSFTVALIKSHIFEANYLRHYGVPQQYERILTDITESGMFAIHAMMRGKLQSHVILDFYRDHLGKPYWADLRKSVGGEVMALILTPPRSSPDLDVVESWRALIGPTDPKKAPLDTLRGRYGLINQPMAYNAVHGSDSQLAAVREADLLFGASFEIQLEV